VLASVSRELRRPPETSADALGITEVPERCRCAFDRRRGSPRAHAGPAPRHRSPSAAVPEDDSEQTRLARAAAVGLDDTPPEKALENLVAQTVDAFGVPYALVSLTLDDAHWFKSHASTSAGALGVRPVFDASFCRYVVESGQPVLVSDATVHPSFAANPLVRGGIVATFAGAPLVTRRGDALGALCILDTRAGVIGAARVDLLARLAKRVAAELELRSEARSSAIEVIRLNEKLAQERERHLPRRPARHVRRILSQLDAGSSSSTARAGSCTPTAAGELLDLTAHRMMGMSREGSFENARASTRTPTLSAKMSSARGSLKALTHEIEQERPSRGSYVGPRSPSIFPTDGRAHYVDGARAPRRERGEWPLLGRSSDRVASSRACSERRAAATGRAKRKG
jgi:GAF domain-containing protein